MTHTLAALRALLSSGKAPAQHRPPRAPGRNVMMHITLDAQHATPLRQALIRDCAGQPWTIRLVPLYGTDRVRLSLYLPREAVSGAIQRVAHLAPDAEVGQLFEIPQTPTVAWRDLMHPVSPPSLDPAGQSDDMTPGNALAQLLAQDHVLLGLEVASRESLFAHLGRFCEHHFGLPAATVIAGLAARESLGSTALGQGVAVPHGQIKGLRRAIALYVRPATPIPFDAPDGNTVSDLVVLLVPESANSTHLHLLADVAQRFCDHHFREQLHACVDAQAVCQLFVGYNAPDAGLSGRPHAPVKSFGRGR
ncbi:nitrogen regulatory IIA protein [Caballeronia udeis]|uniref:Nitrogen regulatory IIA protein n=1 Tax=Caballeronia udeis TaxID=1232866 RepID=A0A158GN95_9BURK|nr:PTS sugar transporter subunit IIA [Caballeronia udeis]SAL33586.1 nitrogen regulatory IIA protein [Caballeronia udeis]